MDDPVMVIVGEWTCSEELAWKFVVQNGQMARCVGLPEDKSLHELNLEIAEAFGVDLQATTVDLSFWYEEETSVLTQRRMPPISIKSDSDLQKFKRKREEIKGLQMYATFRVAERITGEGNIVGVGEPKEVGWWGKCFEMLEDDVLLEHVELLEKQCRDTDMAEPFNTDVDNITNTGLMDKTGLHLALQVDVDGDEDAAGYGNNSVEDEDCEPYNCDAWNDLINKEYPLDWIPQPRQESNWGPLIIHPLETVSRIGGVLNEAGEPSTKKGTSSKDGYLQLFDLGIEALDDETALEENGIEVPGLSSFVEDTVMGFVEADIALLEDAPPVRDNINVIGREEKNMDLRLAHDAVYVCRIFANKEEMHKFLSLYAMKRLFSFKIIKSDR